MNGRIKNDMNTLDAINALAEGVPISLNILAELVQNSNDDRWLLDLVTLDSFSIYGKDIFKLYKDCCESDIINLIDTIAHIRVGMFPSQKIKQNLNLETPVPLVDKVVSKKFSWNQEKTVPSTLLCSKEYQDVILMSFNKRLNEALSPSGKKPSQPGSEE